MDVLRESIRPMVKQILQTLDSHAMLPAHLHAGDLDRIRRAANQLLVLAGRRESISLIKLRPSFMQQRNGLQHDSMKNAKGAIEDGIHSIHRP